MADPDREVRRDREVHVVERSSRGGTAIAAVVALVVLALVAFYVFGGNILGGGTTTETATEAPAETDGAATDVEVNTEAAPAAENGAEGAPPPAAEAEAEPTAPNAAPADGD